MKKTSSRILYWIILVVVIGGAIFYFSTSQVEDDELTIGISQFAEFGALDDALAGFIDALEEAGYVEGENISYDIQNAQGEMSTTTTIANKFSREKPDLVFAIATPSAQAVANEIDDIPILITAVTNPMQVGIETIEEPGINITGTSDLTPVEQQIDLITQIVPDAEKVGVVYNSGESNSEMQLELALEACEKNNLKLIEATAHTSSEVLQAASSLAREDVDALYVWTDNTVVSAIQSVIKAAEDNNIPLIVGEEGGVENGALATIGINYYELGKQTGQMAVEIIEDGTDPAVMPIQYYNGEPMLVVNEMAMERMDVEIPEELLQNAVILD